MLRIRGIRIVANTVDGEFIVEHSFKRGLNIIRGDNTAGKSTMVQCIMYALGIEEMLDGRNEKTMQSVLKEAVEFPAKILHKVIESHVILEIENEEIISIKRSVKNPKKSAKLIEVYKGSVIIEKNNKLIAEQMWVHDKGGASNVKFGFHNFLSRFLSLDMEEVFHSSGDLKLLYVQTLFPAFIIEQKKGWSDFLATIPFFGIRDVKSRVIEVLLKLDNFKNKKKKLTLQRDKGRLTDKWKLLREDLHEVANTGGIDIDGVPASPDVLNSLDFSYLTIKNDNTSIDVDDYLSSLEDELQVMSEISIDITGDRIPVIQSQIRYKTEELDGLMLNHELIRRQIASEYSRDEKYNNQLKDARRELSDNKDAKKIYELGGEMGLKLQKNVCPTCNQVIKDSLLPQSNPHRPMTLDENIKYLKAQESMIVAYIGKQKSLVRSLEQETATLHDKISTIRKSIRSLKEELISDERLPSVEQLETKIRLESKVNFYNRLIPSLRSKINELIKLSKEYEEILKKEERFKKETLTENDILKISSFETNFISLLKDFGYSSKQLDGIKISTEKYLPIVEGELTKYDIRFDSSASDLIRSIWSYTCSLLLTSKKHSGNHPGLLIFDEPAQQSMSNNDFNSFLKELANYRDDQVLVFASFNNSDSDYMETTRGVESFNLINIGEKLMTR